MDTTWDGKPISPEPPHGATVVVYREGSTGAELLLLHRAFNGPEYEGDWAWTPPAGARQPGETIEACAARELYEEAGLTARLVKVDIGESDWAVYYARVAADAEVTLHDEEHDRFEWASLDEALRRCQPERVAEGIKQAARKMRLA